MYTYIVPNDLVDEGRLHKIAVEEMGTERRLNGGGSNWLLGCWNEAHPRTSAWTTILQNGFDHEPNGSKHIRGRYQTHF